MLRFLLIWLLPALLLASCAQVREAADSGDNTMTEARLLKIYENPGYTKAVLLHPSDSTRPLTTLILVPRDSTVPENLPEGILVRTPIQSAAVYSSVHVAVLKELGSIQAVKGVADAQYFTMPEIRAGLENGSVRDIGPIASPSMEILLEMDPDVILASYLDDLDIGSYQKFGLPLLPITDSYETSPLGRAEWIKLFGLLTGRGEDAAKIFAETKSNYAELLKKAPKRAPKVMTENMYQGVWYVPGGASYQARMLKDAGAAYPWAEDSSTGSLSLSYEEVLEKGHNADFWLLKVFDTELTRDGLLKMDPRYEHFSAVDNGGVYYCNTAASPLFEEFPYHPDRLLREYINIFSGAPADSLRYFKPMQR